MSINNVGLFPFDMNRQIQLMLSDFPILKQYQLNRILQRKLPGASNVNIILQYIKRQER